MRKPVAPPRVAAWLLRLFLGAREHETLVGDLQERHTQIAAVNGSRAATRWYWRETIDALVSLATDTTTPGAYPREDSPVRHMLTDIGYAWRTLRRSPTHLVVCALTLGLAIGGMGAIMSVITPLLIEPLPYPNAGRLALVWEKQASGETSNTTFATFTDLKRTVKSIDLAAAVGDWEPTISGSDAAERVQGLRVSADYFRVLGVLPALGNDFQRDQDIPGTTRVVMLSHGLWQRMFGADSQMIGKAIDIGGRPHIVAGVMPASFDDALSPRAEIWRVLGYGVEQPFACRTCRHLRMLVRINENSSIANATAEMDAALRSLATTYPKDYPAAGGSVVGLQEQAVSRVQSVLMALFGAVALILFLAIVTVANLQLTRTMRREGEFAIRAALGAGRIRIARHLLAEALVIAGMATLLSMIVTYIVTPLLVSQLPPSLPRLSSIRMGGLPLAIMLGIGALTTLVIGVLPAFRMQHYALADALRGSQRGSTGRRRTLRNTLVIVEVALALVLTSGATLLARTVRDLMHEDSGFNATNVLTMEIQASGPRYGDDAAIRAHHEAIVERVRQIPGVLSAGVTNQVPLGGNIDGYGVMAEDKPLPNPELAPGADRYVVTPGLLDALGARVLQGRGITADDDRDSTRLVALVSASLARRIWGDESPIGKRIRVGGDQRPYFEVVGVVNDLRHRGLEQAEGMQFYVPSHQWFFSDDVVTLVVRTSAPVEGMQRAIVDAVRAYDRSQPIMRVLTMDALMRESTGQRRLALTLFAAFAILGALLAIAGLYGVLASSVTERTREIGIRAALGASSSNIVGLVMRQSFALLLLGLAGGIVGTLAVVRVLRSMLYGTTGADPMTIAGVVAAAFIVGILSSLVPTMRALRIQPTVALNVS